MGYSDCPAAARTCGSGDTPCREFTSLSAEGRFDKIIAKVSPKRTYSAEARDLIGHAYLMMADKEGTATEKKEQYCLKALEY